MTRDEELMLRFGRRLQIIRKERSVTQLELSQAIDASISSIAFIETGKRFPRLVTLEKLAKVLDVSIADLFEGIEKPRPLRSAK